MPPHCTVAMKSRIKRSGLIQGTPYILYSSFSRGNDMDASSLSMGCNFYLQYVFPKTIHTSPTEGIFSKTSYKFQIRLIHFFKCFGLRKPHPPGNSNPSCGGSMDIFWNCALNLDKRLCMLIFSYDSFCHATSFSSLIQFLS